MKSYATIHMGRTPGGIPIIDFRCGGCLGPSRYVHHPSMEENSLSAAFCADCAERFGSDFGDEWASVERAR